MKLGLITDIHEHFGSLQAALRRLQEHDVDQVVMIGDVFKTGHRIEETCRLLTEANTVGVWGHHVYGLRLAPDDTRTRYGEVTMSYMTSLRPRPVIEDCRFSHVEPWLDHEEIADLWYFEGLPDEQGKLARIFDSVQN